MKFLPPPGPQRWRQLGVLAVAVVVLAIVGWPYVAGGPAGRPAPASNPAGQGSRSDAPMPQPVGLRLDTLEPVPEDSPAGRNLFRFGSRPAPPPPPTPPPVPAPAGPPPPPVPPAPLVQLRFVGWMQPRAEGGAREVILRDPAGAVFHGVEGDILDGRYRIVRVGLESVIVEFVDGTGRRTIPYGGG